MKEKTCLSNSYQVHKVLKASYYLTWTRYDDILLGPIATCPLFSASTSNMQQQCTSVPAGQFSMGDCNNERVVRYITFRLLYVMSMYTLAKCKQILDTKRTHFLEVLLYIRNASKGASLLHKWCMVKSPKHNSLCFL